MEYTPNSHEDQILLLRYQMILMQLAGMSQHPGFSFLETTEERDPIADAWEQADHLKNELDKRGITIPDSDIL